MIKKTVSPKVIIILGFIFFVVVAVSVRAATTVGVNVSVEGTLMGTGAATFTLAGSENLALTNTTATTDTIAVTSTSADSSGVQTSFTLGNNTAADTIGAFEANVTSAATGDADYVTGVLVNNVSSADATVNEIGVYQKGTGWDYGLVTEDTVASILPASGQFNIIGDTTYAAIFPAAANRAEDDGGMLSISARGVEPQAVSIDETLIDDSDASDNVKLFGATFTNLSGDADYVELMTLEYSSNSTAATLGANSKMFRVSVGATTNNYAFPMAVFVQAGVSGGDDAGVDNIITTAFDAADHDITNAIDVGNNIIKGTTATIDFTSFDLDSAGLLTTASLNLGSTTILNHISGTATNMTSANIGATACADYGTITVTGAAVGDTVYASPDATSSSSGIEDLSLSWNAVVSSSGTVTIRACNPTGTGINAGDDQEWRADVWQH